MMIRKKGLSTVVTTLIIVLLVLAAIGLIWGPIRNLLTGSTNSLDQTKCLNFGFKVIKVDTTNAASGFYNVTIQREATGTDTNAIGAKIIFYSATNNTDMMDNFPGGGQAFTPLKIQTASFDAGVFNATKMDIIPYYLDPNTGEQKICNTQSTFTISAA